MLDTSIPIYGAIHIYSTIQMCSAPTKALLVMAAASTAFPMSCRSSSVVVLRCSPTKPSMTFPTLSSPCASLEVKGASTSYPSLSVLTCFPHSVLPPILHPCKVAGLLFRLGLGYKNNLSGSKSNLFHILILWKSNSFLEWFRKPGCVGLIPSTAFGVDGPPGLAPGRPPCFHAMVKAPGFGCSSSRWDRQGLTLELVPQEGNGELFWPNMHQVPVATWAHAAKSLRPWTEVRGFSSYLCHRLFFPSQVGPCRWR